MKALNVAMYFFMSLKCLLFNDIKEDASFTLENTANSKCSDGWEYFKQTDSCYHIIHQCTYDNCEAQCQTLNAHLVSIHSDEENIFVNKLTADGLPETDILIGLYRDNLIWKWVDGSVNNYTYWDPFPPATNLFGPRCAITYANPPSGFPLYSWIDTNCSSVNIFHTAMCKQPAPIFPLYHSACQNGFVSTSVNQNACYKFYNELKSKEDSSSFCNDLNGYLTSIHSLNENSFLITWTNESTFWLGYSNNETQKWDDGSLINFTNWDREQNVTGMCAIIEASSNGLWITSECEKNLSFICESPSTLNSTSTQKSPLPLTNTHCSTLKSTTASQVTVSPTKEAKTPITSKSLTIWYILGGLFLVILTIIALYVLQPIC